MGALIMILVWICLVLVVGSGWVMNIIHLVNTPLSPLTTELIIRFIGVPIAPVGVVMGWFF
jgi:hypothetical protein